MFGYSHAQQVGPKERPGMFATPREALLVIAGWLVFMLAIVGTVLAVASAARAEVITYDRGGLIGERAEIIRASTDAGQTVRIDGRCDSACTMHLAHGCVTPRARLTFHGPSNYGQPLSPERFDHWSRVLARHYSPPLAEWFITTGRYTEITFTGAELIRAGWAEGC